MHVERILVAHVARKPSKTAPNSRSNRVKRLLTVAETKIIRFLPVSSYRHARDIIESWRIDYNLIRPHTSLDGLTPYEFATQSNKDHTVNRANL